METLSERQVNAEAQAAGAARCDSRAEPQAAGAEDKAVDSAGREM